MLDLIERLNDKIETQPKNSGFSFVHEFPLNNLESYPAFLPSGSKWNLVFHTEYNSFYYHDKELSMWLSVNDYHGVFTKLNKSEYFFHVPYVDQYIVIDSILIYNKNDVKLSIGGNIPIDIVSGRFYTKLVLIPGSELILEGDLSEHFAAHITYRLVG